MTSMATAAPATFDAYDEEQITAQVVVDALRVLLMAQDDDKKALGMVKEMLDWAPGTENNNGLDLILRMISEGSLRVELK